METSTTWLARLWRSIRWRPRLATSIAFGASMCVLLPAGFSATTRALLAWDVGAATYLALAWHLFARASVEHMQWRARVQDDGAAAVLFLTVAAATASLAAIVLELADIKMLPPARQGLHLALVGATFAASWLLVHTSFALHYAHVYYRALDRRHPAPLAFPQQTSPVYVDFLYFATVIGMTSQTADVALNATRMRRLVLAHGMIAFVFNTTLLALAINIVASLRA